MKPAADLDEALGRRLAALREQGLYRELRRVDSPQSARIQIDGKTLLNFGSNDYLGLANEPALKEAAVKAVEQFGTGAGASRLVCGSLTPHHELDETLAAFKGTQAALSFSTGYATALGALCALMQKEDVVVIDKRVHASIIDAARLSGAKLRVFAHNDPNDLEEILNWAAAKRPQSQVLIATESVFSMDGDRAPLRAIADLKDKYGAWLMVDEAHAAGLFGNNRRGLAEAEGYICGSRILIDFLVNRARSFIFSTAPPPAAAAAAVAGLQFIRSQAGADRCRSLWRRVSECAPGLGLQTTPPPSAIFPIVIGNETKALDASAALRAQGIFLPAIRYPTVARGQARLRLTVTAAHSPEDVSTLTAALHSLGIGL
jgi:7-keto-8-aminopelargonate synthetase-like enzyme